MVGFVYRVADVYSHTHVPSSEHSISVTDIFKGTARMGDIELSERYLAVLLYQPITTCCRQAGHIIGFAGNNFRFPFSGDHIASAAEKET